jgi:glycosyltransferase involved in cell wall biosynthesis
LEDQNNGLLFPPGSPEALATCMELLLSQPALAFELGRQARLKVQAHYSMDAVAQKYAELYGFLLNKQAFH